VRHPPDPPMTPPPPSTTPLDEWRVPPTTIDPRCVMLAVFLFVAFLLKQRLVLSAGALGASMHLVVLADPAREAELGDRQIRALARVASELAEGRA